MLGNMTRKEFLLCAATSMLLAICLAALACPWRMATADDEVAVPVAEAPQPQAEGDAGQGDGEAQETVALAEGADASGQVVSEAPQTVTPAVVKKITATVCFTGTDGEWAKADGLELDEGANAWDATRLALTQSELSYKTGTTSGQDVIVSITRASDGTTASFDPGTGSGWHLYVNGERCPGSSSSIVLADGDTVEWVYEVGTFMVSVSVVGPGGTEASYWVAPTSVRMEATKTAWDASLAVFHQSGYGEGRLLSYSTGQDGSVQLESLAALGENGITGESWQVFVNGEVPETDIAHVQLHAGDSICWYYAGRGEMSLPSFVEQTGAASQSPATSVAIEGIVSQAWVQRPPVQTESYTILERVGGLAVMGRGESQVLVGEGTSLMNPLSQLGGGSGWQNSLAHAMNSRNGTGEGIGSIMGLDRSLYYVDSTGSVVKLRLDLQ